MTNLGATIYWNLHAYHSNNKLSSAKLIVRIISCFRLIYDFSRLPQIQYTYDRYNLLQFDHTSLFHQKVDSGKKSAALVVFFFLVPKNKIPFSTFYTMSKNTHLRTNIRNIIIYKNTVFRMFIRIVEAYHQYYRLLSNFKECGDNRTSSIFV